MLSLIRSGPKILILESPVINKLSEYIKNKFGVISYTLNEAFEKTTEGYTIILIVEKLNEIVHINEIKKIFTIKEDSDVVLSSMFNDRNCHLVTKSRIAPRILIMRVFGNIEKIITEIKEDYNAESGNFLDMLDNHNNQGTILTFTQNPLNKSIGLSDLYKTSLFVKEKHSVLRRNIRIHGLKYLNEGLDKKDWYELEIKIYDIYGAYLLHYKRLLKILESLELGLILGESWGKDIAHVFLSVGVYRIRFFTFHDPIYIKKILIGLEYLDDKTRIVDYDIYYKRKKIYWTDAKEENLKSKIALSKKYRKFIFSKLDEKEKTDILKLEKEILQTRK